MESRWPDQYAEYVKFENNPDRSPVPPHAKDARRKARQRTKAKPKIVPVPKRAPSQKSNSPRSPSRSRSATPYESRVAYDDKGEVLQYSKTDKVNAAAAASKRKSPSPLPPIEWNIAFVQARDRSPRKPASRSPKRDSPAAAPVAAPAGEAQTALNGEVAAGGSESQTKATLSPGAKGKGKSKGKRKGKGRGGKAAGRGGRGSKGRGRAGGRGWTQWGSRKVVLSKGPGKNANSAGFQGRQR
mgnify:CR=1 FL=1